MLSRAFICCDLLSNCILSIFETPIFILIPSVFLLWFAFKLYFIDLWNTWSKCSWRFLIVVICFQIVFYRSLKHRPGPILLSSDGCDLLSNCILSIFETPVLKRMDISVLLWFAFKLYFIDLWNTNIVIWTIQYYVVICFQIVFYRSLKHHSKILPVEFPGCDLLSNCILSIFETPSPIFHVSSNWLWFAFKLYFIDLWNTEMQVDDRDATVVICFQIVFYRSLKHQVL